MNSASQQPRPLAILPYLWEVITPWRSKLVLGLFALMIVSLTSLAYPLLLKIMVDRQGAIIPNDIGAIVFVGALGVLFFISALAGYFQHTIMQELGFRLRNELRLRMYGAALAQPLEAHQHARVGNISVQISENIGAVQPFFSNLVAPVFQNVLIIGGCLILMSTLNGLATLIVVGLLVVPFPLVFILGRRVQRLSAESRATHGEAHASLEESLVAIKDVTAFVREKTERTRYAEYLRTAFDSEQQATRLQGIVSQTLHFVFSILLVGIFYVGTAQVLFPGWSMGSVIAFYFYAFTLTLAVIALGRSVLSTHSMLGTLEGVIGMIRRSIPDEPDQIVAQGQRSGSSVIFDRVSFRYAGGQQVLKEVSFEIPGNSWAIISGPSGSGKTTLANLLLGFYSPQEGTIRIDGTPSNAWNKSSLRKQIVYVGQDAVLFHGTILDNLEFGSKDWSETGLDDILSVACLEDFLRELPKGFRTPVGERGTTLSSGQRMRIALARALLMNPSILVLDEIGRTIEPSLEKSLWQRLYNYRRNQTTIIMTHQLEHIPDIPLVYSLVRLPLEYFSS